VVNTSVAKKQATLAQWLKDISAHLNDVFYEVKSDNAADHLSNWYYMDMNEVIEWYKQ